MDFERVYVELDWYDGIRAGIADVDGTPHHFRAVDYVELADEVGYLVWPVPPGVLGLEIEQWAMFCGWNDRYEAGTATTDTHPGGGGVDPRYDELTGILEPHRSAPAGARRMSATWRPLGRATRYHRDGPGFDVRWSVDDG